ncbi:hypothetical protein PSTT_01256 [Puccinia striiformis]|uniref:Uncharacterized protein n=1 Tax=Puccinia striiformis TaxID=27350 RepID=A0A2S4W3S3_9BASI|nr:hypothetical protein PSTT_01256 [Puccinia striiformis]
MSISPTSIPARPKLQVVRTTMQIWKQPILFLIFIGAITLTCGALHHYPCCTKPMINVKPADGVAEKICDEPGCDKTYDPKVVLTCSSCTATSTETRTGCYTHDTS